MDEKQLLIWFDQLNEFIKIDDGIKYLVLLRYNEIYDRIKYIISRKSGSIILIGFKEFNDLMKIMIGLNIL